MNGREITKIARDAKLYATRTQKPVLPFLQMQALRHIIKHPGCHLCELQEKLGSDKAAISRMVKALEKKGYIEKLHQGRCIALYAQAEAHQLPWEIKDEESQYYDWLLAQITQREREQFLMILEQLYQCSRKERKVNYIHIGKE